MHHHVIALTSKEANEHRQRQLGGDALTVSVIIYIMMDSRDTGDRDILE